MNIRVLLADNHRLMRNSLRSLIDKQPGMEVVAEAECAGSTLKCAYELKPDVVVMDINMVDMKNTDVVRQMIAECPYLKLVALSIYPNREFVVGMLDAGASCYLLKDCAFEELIPAIRLAFNNQTYLSAGLGKDIEFISS